MKTLRLVVLVMGLAALAVGVAGVASGTRSGSRVLEETERAFVLAPGQAIAVENINGPIEYEAWDGREVVVRAVKEARGPVAFARWVAERIPISIEQTDDGVRAGYGRLFYWGFGWANLRLSFRVLVPRDWEGDISLYTSNGRITARDLRGDARLRTSNGSVVVERQAGSLAVKTSNGRIELRDVDGVVTAETSNGAIVVDGAGSRAPAASGRAMALSNCGPGWTKALPTRCAPPTAPCGWP